MKKSISIITLLILLALQGMCQNDIRSDSKYPFYGEYICCDKSHLYYSIMLSNDSVAYVQNNNEEKDTFNLQITNDSIIILRGLIDTFNLQLFFDEIKMSKIVFFRRTGFLESGKLFYNCTITESDEGGSRYRHGKKKIYFLYQNVTEVWNYSKGQLHGRTYAIKGMCRVKKGQYKYNVPVGKWKFETEKSKTILWYNDEGGVERKIHQSK